MSNKYSLMLHTIKKCKKNIWMFKCLFFWKIIEKFKVSVATLENNNDIKLLIWAQFNDEHKSWEYK